MTIQAPSGPLVSRHDDEHDEGEHGAEAVDRGAPLPARRPQAAPPQEHPGLRQRERQEHANHVERDQLVRVAVEHPDQTAGRHAERDDAVAERQLVALVHELPRHEAVARDDRRQPRKVGVRRVRRQHQDRHRHHLQRVVEQGAAAEHRAADLRHDRVALGRNGADRRGQIADADEHRDRDGTP